MGSQTPIFALRYPFETETVDPTHFKNLADDIDAALDLIDVRKAQVLNKPALRLRQETDHTGVASGATAIVTWDTVDYNPNGWWNAGAPTLIALPAGIYQVTVGHAQIFGGTGMVQSALDIQMPSGTTWSRKTTAYSAGVTAGTSHHAVVYTATPQNLRITWSWWGSAGTGTNPSTALAIRQIKPL